MARLNGEAGIPILVCISSGWRGVVATRLGVDVGGTFSDLVMYDEEAGRIVAAKGLSTPSSPELGVLAVVADTASHEQLGRARFFLHGTTVGLNALLERRGSLVAMLATRGFRDVLEIRRGDRLAAYDPAWRPNPPLVPRALRFPVTERIAADGAVLTPLDSADIEAALEMLAEAGVESVAISFINAYANPQHELLARDLLVAAGFEGDISMSHDVSGEFREYERTSTTVIDAYVRPRVAHYLTHLAGGLADEGFAGTELITRCGGGSLTFTEAERRPFETVMSGPVAGVIGAAELCGRLGIEMAITADVGGTSFDTCLIVDGEPHLKHEGEIDSMPVQTPWVDVRSIGAGGGSIVHVDAGLLRVGPHSAGALPGPACYGAGGSQPTVTDATVLLGMIPPGEIAGGIVLDVAAAERALESVGAAISLSAFETAIGALRVVASTMADAIRSVSLEQGHDPRRATLLPYGGAGPLFATLLANELDVTRIVLPKYPGNFSAWGMLHQNLAQSAATSAVQPLDDEGIRRAQAILGDLFARLRGRSDARLDSLESVDEVSLDLRYVGQEYSLNVPLEIDEARSIRSEASQIIEQFTASYERTFGHSLDEAVEIVTVRGTRRRLLPAMGDATDAAPVITASTVAGHHAYSFTQAATVPVEIHERSSIGTHDLVIGPAIVTEPTATAYVDIGWQARIIADDALLIEPAVAGAQ
jgi:N-methylhydantoinase A